MVAIVRRIVVIISLVVCFLSFVLCPVFIQAQTIPEEQNLDTDILEDHFVRPLYFYKRGQLAESSDVHVFRMPLKADKAYVTKLWLTAEDGGTYYLRLKGELTEMEVSLVTPDNLKNRLLEVVYTADEDTVGRIVFTYYTVTSDQEPTYTLYANRMGIAGWWWIALAGIGILAIFLVMFSFMIIGMRSVAKKGRSKKRKK